MGGALSSHVMMTAPSCGVPAPLPPRQSQTPQDVGQETCVSSSPAEPMDQKCHRVPDGDGYGRWGRVWPGNPPPTPPPTRKSLPLVTKKFTKKMAVLGCLQPRPVHRGSWQATLDIELVQGTACGHLWEPELVTHSDDVEHNVIQWHCCPWLALSLSPQPGLQELVLLVTVHWCRGICK